MSQVTSAAPNGVAPAEQPWLEVLGSRHFAAWLAEQNVCLALTTYQAGKLFLVGRQPGGRISVFERTFNRCMSLWTDGSTIWMSSLYQLWRLENGLKPGHSHDGHDALYIPRIGYTTGDIDLHATGSRIPREPRMIEVRSECHCPDFRPAGLG